MDGTVLLFNEAKFEDAASPDILDELNFVAAESGESLDSVKQRTPGWTFICDAQIYVQGHVKRAVFGEANALKRAMLRRGSPNDYS